MSENSYVFLSPMPPRDQESWRVMFDGVIQRPDFNSRGAALAFLAGLQSGARKPEPSA